MRLQVNPWWFFVKLVVFLTLAYFAWQPLAPYYARFLLRAVKVGVWLTEFSTDPNWQHPTELLMRPERSPTAIFFRQKYLFDRYHLDPQGIPAEWVMANLVLLVPLMLATPAPTWRARILRLLAALAAALVLQVFDVVMTIKAFYASTFRADFNSVSRQIYQFFDAFVQSWDTQLFPFAIWAGVHFRLLLPRRMATDSAAPPAAPRAAGTTPAASGSRAQRRRQQRTKR